jgi:poly(3-hydroxybutyrate) depolymerase
MKNLYSLQIKFILFVIIFILINISLSSAEDSKFIKEEIVVGKETREFYVYIPETAKKINNPVIIAFHGFESNANAMRYLIHPDLLSQEYGFIMVYPQGIRNSWNAGIGRGALRSESDDESFVSQMIDTLISKYKINKKEVFTLGFSNGAQMAVSAACNLPKRIRAVGMVSHVYNLPSCSFTDEIPIAIIHAIDDNIVPFKGGGINNFPSHDSTVKYFKLLNKTDTSSSIVLNKNTVTCLSFKNKAEDVEVIDCICNKGGHTWPGGLEVDEKLFGSVNKDLNATEFMMKFFTKYCSEPIQFETGFSAINDSSKIDENKIKSITRYGFLVTDNLYEEDNKGETEWQKIVAGIKSSFSFKNNRQKKNSTLDKLFDGFSGNFAFIFPIRKSEVYNKKGSNSQGEPNNNLALTASLRYNPISYWFADVTLYKYINTDLQAPWHPDYTYTFGYDDWHPYTFSLVYGNYNGNRFNLNNNETSTNFWEGIFSLGWKFPTFNFFESLLKVHSTSGLGHKISYNVVPKYSDISIDTKQDWKQSISLYTKYSIYKSFYIDVNLFYYLNPSQQQPWDPDFTYTFGYFDWHAGTFSFQYSNYSGNRYFWRDQQTGNTGSFADGFFLISWSWIY